MQRQRQQSFFDNCASRCEHTHKTHNAHDAHDTHNTQ